MTFFTTMQHVPFLSQVVRQTRSLRSRMIDRQLNINTAEDWQGVKAAASEFNDHREFEAMDFGCIRAFLAAMRPGRNDVVYDIDCGTGRVVCVAARMGIRKSVGVELCPEFVDAARTNAHTLADPKSPIEMRLQDASKTDYSDGTMYCLFNSFGTRTLNVVLEQIRSSLIHKP